MQKEVIDYEVVSEITTKNLQTAMKQKLHAGWQPYGNVMMQNIPDGQPYFHQAIVKYKV